VKRKEFGKFCQKVPGLYSFYCVIARRQYGLKKEMTWFLGKSPEEAARELMAYSIISFDVFDTLIFRSCAEPTEVFQRVEETAKVPGFRKFRCEMEQRAREKLYQSRKWTEVTLDEIYKVMEQEKGIDRNIMQMELREEYQVCYANSYMKRLIQELRGFQKRIIVISDMYLGQEQIFKILEQAGYEKFDAYYISSDYRVSKREGKLYEVVKEKEGKDHSYAHVGDNWISDIRQARKHGITAFYYRKQKEICKNER